MQIIQLHANPQCFCPDCAGLARQPCHVLCVWEPTHSWGSDRTFGMGAHSFSHRRKGRRLHASASTPSAQIRARKALNNTWAFTLLYHSLSATHLFFFNFLLFVRMRLFTWNRWHSPLFSHFVMWWRVIWVAMSPKDRVNRSCVSRPTLQTAPPDDDDDDDDDEEPEQGPWWENSLSSQDLSYDEVSDLPVKLE